MNDNLLKAYAFNDSVRLYVADTTQLVEKARRIHDLWPTSAAALGRLLTVSVIMGAMYGNQDELTLRIDSDGPIEGMVTTTNNKGEVRGYVGNPHVFLQHNTGKLNVGSAVGTGMIHVTKNLKVRDIFTSTSAIQTGEIGEDFAHYFKESEQIPSAVSVGVKVNPDNTIQHAGGFILQVMPGCDQETIAHIENVLTQIPPVTTMLDNGKSTEDIVKSITSGDYNILHSLDLKYHCSCSKETFERGLIALGKDDLQTLLEDDGKIETVCHFCLSNYLFNENELRTLIKQAD